MAKRYVLSFEDLQNLIHSSMTFFAERAKQCMKDNRVPMFSDRIKWIDEFLHENLRELPLDDLLNEVEDKFSTYFGKSFDEIKESLRERNQSVEDVKKSQEEVKEFGKRKGIF